MCRLGGAPHPPSCCQCPQDSKTAPSACRSALALGSRCTCCTARPRAPTWGLQAPMLVTPFQPYSRLLRERPCSSRALKNIYAAAVQRRVGCGRVCVLERVTELFSVALKSDHRAAACMECNVTTSTKHTRPMGDRVEAKSNGWPADHGAGRPEHGVGDPGSCRGMRAALNGRAAQLSRQHANMLRVRVSRLGLWIQARAARSRMDSLFHTRPARLHRALWGPPHGN